MDKTRFAQLAVRGALEMPNNPFLIIDDITLEDAKKLTAKERRARAIRQSVEAAKLYRIIRLADYE